MGNKKKLYIGLSVLAAVVVVAFVVGTTTDLFKGGFIRIRPKTFPQRPILIQLLCKIPPHLFKDRKGTGYVSPVVSPVPSVVVSMMPSRVTSRGGTSPVVSPVPSVVVSPVASEVAYDQIYFRGCADPDLNYLGNLRMIDGEILKKFAREEQVKSPWKFTLNNFEKLKILKRYQLRLQ